MRYFFLENVDISTGQVIISGDEYNHVVKVNRLEVGDQCFVIDGKGLRVMVRIDAVTKKEVKGTILSHEFVREQSGPMVIVCCALSRKGVFHTVVEKAVELGAAVIVAIASERCVVKVEDEEAFVRKHTMTVREAMKQCHRTVAPLIKGPVSVAYLKDVVQNADRRFLLDPSNGVLPKTVLQAARGKTFSPQDQIALAIGPEGGFSEEEKRLFAQMKFENVWFPDTILRTDTAVIAMLSLIRYGV